MIILIYMASFLAVAGVAAAERPSDYAYGMTLEADGREALYEVTLPAAVYRGVTRADLADVRVFNGAGEVVPHAWRPRRGAAIEPVSSTALTLFPLRAPAGSNVEGLSITVTRGPGGASRVQVGAGEGQGSKTMRTLGYLVDLTAYERSLRAIEFDWKGSPDGYAGKLRIDASEDLGNWRTLVAAAPLVNLEVGGQRLQQRRIELPQQKAKYLRLAWVAGADDAAPPELTAASGEFAPQAIDAEREWLSTEPRRGEKAGEFLFDLQGRHPVDRVRLLLPEPNTVVQLELLARNQADEPWRGITRGVAYRLRRGETEVLSPALAFPASTERYWLVRIDTRGGGVGSGEPRLEAGWVPHQLVFAARGAAPFQLAYGNRAAKPGALAIETLIPGYRDDIAAGVRRTRAGAEQVFKVRDATAMAPTELGGDARRQEAIDWKRWSLWGALLLGVLVLGVMAWRLSKQLGGPPK